MFPRTLALVAKALLQTLLMLFLMLVWLPSPDVLLLQVSRPSRIALWTHAWCSTCCRDCSSVTYARLPASVCKGHAARHEGVACMLGSAGRGVSGSWAGNKERAGGRCIWHDHAGAACDPNAAAVLAGLQVARRGLRDRLAQLCVHAHGSVHAAAPPAGERQLSLATKYVCSPEHLLEMAVGVLATSCACRPPPCCRCRGAAGRCMPYMPCELHVTKDRPQAVVPLQDAATTAGHASLTGAAGGAL